MGVIWTSRTRTKQPQGVSGKPSPTFRPRILATPSSQFESVGGRLREVSGGYTIGTGLEGVATICPTTQIPGFVAYTVAAPVSITGDYSLLVYASASGNSSGLETHTIDHGGALALTAFQFSNTSIVGFLDGNTTGSISGVFTQPTVAIAVRRGNTAWLYVGNQSSSGVTGTRAGEPTGLVIGRDRVSNDPAGGVKTYLYALFDYGLSAPEIASLIKNPWQLFAPSRTPSFFGTTGGGGTTYNISISETASASEIAGAVAAFLASINETSTASETVATTAVLNASISETATASETVAAAASFVVTIGETATASETVAMALGAATFAVDISETATASETVSMLAAFGTSISETATASDLVSMLALFQVGISETATASETVAMQLANQTYAVDISETATASDTVVMTIPTTYAISIIETVQAGDYVSMGVPSSDFWTQVTTTQSAGWGQINNTQSSGWTIIPTT